MSEIRELQRQRRKMLKQMLRSKQPASGRVITTVAPIGEMLMDDRFGENTMRLLEICYESAHGRAEKQDCFCCLQPWSRDRIPESIGCAEFVERPNEKPTRALMFAICWACCFDRPAVLAALKRDFGDFAELSNTPGTA